ncbi:MAG: hypothetical protein LBK66_03615, partial [Spirochaetaceae bacterium]|jgi:hypothetical protein|nr:hypothetical protein [Spirochaetaceae bacterium]
LRLFQNFSFGTATLDLMEKAGRTLVRLDRFFQELVPKPCALAHSRLVLEQAHIPLKGRIPKVFASQNRYVVLRLDWEFGSTLPLSLSETLCRGVTEKP